MKIKLRLFPLMILGILVSGTALSQAKKVNQQPLPIVVYNPNVEAPLTSKELKFINEVYGTKTQEDVLSHPQRIKDIKNILRNRVTYQRIDDSRGFKDSQLLSEVPLFDDYVMTLERDKVFNPATFNPLKYQFNFYARGGEQYKVDNSNYYIFIEAQHIEAYRLKSKSSKSKN